MTIYFANVFSGLLLDKNTAFSFSEGIHLPSWDSCINKIILILFYMSYTSILSNTQFYNKK